MYKTVSASIAVLFLSTVDALARCNGGSTGRPSPEIQKTCKLGIFSIWKTRPASIEANRKIYRINFTPFLEQASTSIELLADSKFRIGLEGELKQEHDTDSGVTIITPDPGQIKFYISVTRPDSLVQGEIQLTFFEKGDCRAKLRPFG